MKKNIFLIMICIVSIAYAGIDWERFEEEVGKASKEAAEYADKECRGELEEIYKKAKEDTRDILKPFEEERVE